MLKKHKPHIICSFNQLARKRINKDLKKGHQFAMSIQEYIMHIHYKKAIMWESGFLEAYIFTRPANAALGIVFLSVWESFSLPGSLSYYLCEWSPHRIKSLPMALLWRGLEEIFSFCSLFLSFLVNFHPNCLSSTSVFPNTFTLIFSQISTQIFAIIWEGA